MPFYRREIKNIKNIKKMSICSPSSFFCDYRRII